MATSHTGTYVYTDFDFNGVSRIINIPDATEDQSPVTLAQFNSFSEGLAWKDNVRVASQGNITLSSPGATINGITMAQDDRVLVKAQDDAKTNGIYIWNSASTPMVRSSDMNSSLEFNNAVITVDEGSSAGVSFRQTTVKPVLGDDDIIFSIFGTGTPTASETTGGTVELATQVEVNIGTDPGRVITPATLTAWTGQIKKYSVPIGDTSATSFTVNHGLGTRDVTVSVYRNSGNYDQVLVDVQHTDLNNITVKFATGNAPGTDAFQVVVMGQIDDRGLT